MTHRLVVYCFGEVHGHDNVQTRADADVANLAGVMTERYIQTAMDFLTLFGAVAMLLALNWRLALLSMASLPFFVWSVIYFGRKIHWLSWKNQEEHAQVAARFGDVFNMAYIIKIFGRERSEVLRLVHQLHRFVRSNMDLTVLGMLCNISMGCIATLAPLSIIWYGGYEVIQGTLSIGGLFAFNMYVVYLFGPLRSIYGTIQSVQGSAASLQRIYEVLDQPAEGSGTIDVSNAVTQSLHGPAIEFRGVSFSYRPETPTLTNISFRIEPGQTVALVGPSGAGKTTIFHLLLRLYDYQDGSILLDGVDLRQYATHSVRQLFRFVPQDAQLFNRTIEENIRFGSPRASHEEVQACSAQAHVSAFVREIPGEYQAAVGQRGTMLSAGQRQRISIARALVSNPRILLLDEATAFLDANTESEVQRAMNESAQGRTCLIIAHRLSTAVNSDQILVMEHGRIVDQGTHAELYARCPLYSGLCDKQFKPAESIQTDSPHCMDEEHETLLARM